MTPSRTLDIDLHPNQYTIYNDEHRFKIVACGRRFGKSLLCSRAIAVHALQNPGGIYYIVAPVVAQTGIIWRMITRWLPKTAIQNIYTGDRRIVLKGGSEIFAKSGDNPDSLRGEGLSGVILDEAAMLRPDVWYEAIRPALADKMGFAWLISTPKGKNWFYSEYNKGTSDEEKYKDYISYRFTSYDNPFLRKSEIDLLSETLSELSFKQEILAEFIEGGGEVFRDFAGCITDGILAPYNPKSMYVMGVDLGRLKDFTVIYVAELGTNCIRYCERFNKTSWDYIESRICSVYEQYGAPTLMLDSTGSGEPVYERLIEAGVNVYGININQATKPMLVKSLSLAFERRRLWIPDIVTQNQELSAYSFKTTPFGNIQYSAPSGFHDDHVMALALCNYALNGPVPSCVGTIDNEATEATIYDEMDNYADWNDSYDLDDGYDD